jgi:hypothetical protein
MSRKDLHPAWELTGPWPGMLIAYREDPGQPDLESTLAGLAEALGETINIIELLSNPADGSPFKIMLSIPGFPCPVLFGCERTRGPEELPPSQRDRLGACAWVLYCETLFDQEDPIASYVRLAEVLAFDGQTLAILDGQTHRWFDEGEIQSELLDQSIPPSERCLWETRVVSESPDLEEGTAWVYTTGLLRCGLPELEMTEVVADKVHRAVKLLDVAASLALESGFPPPEIPWRLGKGIEVVLLPWAEVIETLDPESLGSVEDREKLTKDSPNPLVAARAAVCDVKPRGTYKLIHRWAEHAMDTMALTMAQIYKSDLATTRDEMLAQRTWPRVIDALAIAPPGVTVFVCLSLEVEGERQLEQAWIQLMDCSELGGVGRLLRDAESIEVGAPIEFGVAEVTGWRLIDGTRTISSLDDVDPVAFYRDGE